MVINDYVICENNHRTNVSIKNGQIISKETFSHQSELLKNPNIPDHIKRFIEEAYLCLNAKASRAGASMVRLMLDGLLWEIGFKDRMAGEKLTNFEK